MRKFSILNLKFSKNEAGFTLVEMVITVMVFSMLVVTVTAIFMQAVRVERQAVLAQRIQENAMHVLESIAKEIRVSYISDQDSPGCAITPLNTLTIVHPVNGVVVYRLNSEGNIERQSGATTTILNSSVTQFTRFNFCVTGSEFNDNQSAKVTILISIQNRTGAGKVSVNVQTTVVSRDVTTEFQYP